MFEKRLYEAFKAQNIYYLFLWRKRLPTSALEDFGTFRKNLSSLRLTGSVDRSDKSPAMRTTIETGCPHNIGVGVLILENYLLFIWNLSATGHPVFYLATLSTEHGLWNQAVWVQIPALPLTQLSAPLTTLCLRLPSVKCGWWHLVGTRNSGWHWEDDQEHQLLSLHHLTPGYLSDFTPCLSPHPDFTPATAPGLAHALPQGLPLKACAPASSAWNSPLEFCSAAVSLGGPPRPSCHSLTLYSALLCPYSFYHSLTLHTYAVGSWSILLLECQFSGGRILLILFTCS